MHRCDAASASAVLEIGELRIDRRSATANAGGATLPLGVKVVATLLALHDRAGYVVSKADLIASVWGDLPIDESSLWQNVHVLRGVLKRHAPVARIETVKGRGYRLILDQPASDESTLDEPAAANVSAAVIQRRTPGWLWSLGGAAAAALVFGVMHVAQPAPRAQRVLVLVGTPSDRLPPLPPLPRDGSRTQIVLAPSLRN